MTRIRNAIMAIRPGIVQSAPAYWFLLMSLLFGSCYALLIPPFQSPDEPNHFLRAWQVSEGHWLPEQMPDQRLGAVLPFRLQQLADTFAFLKNNEKARLYRATIDRAWDLPLEPGNRGVLDFANTAIYAPTAYIPQALAIIMLRPLGVGPLFLLYGCRLFNLWCWCLLVFQAIRWLPAQRWTLVFLALLPASLVMAASCNADGLTNGLCWWLFAICYRGTTATRWRWASLLAMIVVGMNKLIGVVLVLLQFLKPRAPGQPGILAILGSTLGIALAWGLLAQFYFIPYDAYNPVFRDGQTLNPGVEPMEQLRFIAGHPLQFLATLLRSFAHAMPSTTAHIIGKFGWEKNYLPAWALGLLALALVVLIFSEPNPATRKQRWLSAGVAAGYILLFAITMYALWCPVGAAELSNLQGRYFVPVLPLLALALGGQWIRVPGKALLSGVLSLTIVGQVAMLYAIIERYYAL